MRACIAASAIAEPDTPPISVASAIDTCAEAALQPPGQHRGELEQPLRDAGVVHEVAGEDEERHREQREVLRLARW